MIKLFAALLWLAAILAMGSLPAVETQAAPSHVRAAIHPQGNDQQWRLAPKPRAFDPGMDSRAKYTRFQKAERRPGRQRPRKLTAPDRAAAIARSATGGRVLSVTKERPKDKRLYRVRILTHGGRVRSVLVNTRTGELVE